MISDSHFRDRRRSSKPPLVRAQRSLATTWHVSLRFTLNAFRHGVEPLAIINRLRALGQNSTVAVVDDRLPQFAGMDPLSCHLGFEINLLTEAPCSEIEAVFDAVREDCVVRIFPPNRRSSDLLTLMNSLPDEGRLGDILVECGAISRESLDEAIAQHNAAKQAAGEAAHEQVIGEILVEQQRVSNDMVEAALLRQSMARQPVLVREVATAGHEVTIYNLLDRTAALCAGLKSQDPAQQEMIEQLKALTHQIRSAMPVSPPSDC